MAKVRSDGLSAGWNVPLSMGTGGTGNGEGQQQAEVTWSHVNSSAAQADVGPPAARTERCC